MFRSILFSVVAFIALCIAPPSITEKENFVLVTRADAAPAMIVIMARADTPAPVIVMAENAPKIVAPQVQPAPKLAVHKHVVKHVKAKKPHKRIWQKHKKKHFAVAHVGHHKSKVSGHHKSKAPSHASAPQTTSCSPMGFFGFTGPPGCH